MATTTFDRGSGFGGRAPDYRGRLRRARLGLAVAITPILMLFVSFTSAYVVRQGLPTLDERSGAYVHDWLAVSLPVRLLLVNTIVLIVSSISLEVVRQQIARQAALTPVASIRGVSIGEERISPWLGVTVALGAGFLAGQFLAWRELAYRGFYVATSPSSSFVYLLTATHAIHLAGGLVALLYAVFILLRQRPIEACYIVIDTVAWYWHFMALLWIYIFALLWFAR